MESSARHLFTSESVTEGHPDKIADQISDAILDAILAKTVRHMAGCTVVRIGPRNMGRQIAHDLPAREAALDGRQVLLPQRSKDQAPGFEHRGRGHGWLGGRHVGSRFRAAGGTGPLRSAPAIVAGLWEDRL